MVASCIAQPMGYITLRGWLYYAGPRKYRKYNFPLPAAP
jgi:hypothetical protein